MADGSVKLGDFCISKSLSTQTDLALTACGSPFYFSPELINSQSYREPTDVWALGVLLFELLTLQRPFNGGNIAVLALAITNGAYDEKALELSPYPQWMRRLASKEKLLHPDPEKRLPLPELLAAVGGLNGDESEASLLALKAQGPSPILLALKTQGSSPLPSIMRVQQSLRGAQSLPASSSVSVTIHEEALGPGRDGLHSPSKEPGTSEDHATKDEVQQLQNLLDQQVVAALSPPQVQAVGQLMNLARPLLPQRGPSEIVEAILEQGADLPGERAQGRRLRAGGEDLDDLDAVYAADHPHCVDDDFDATGSV